MKWVGKTEIGEYLMLSDQNRPESNDAGVKHPADLRSATRRRLLLLGLIVVGGLALRLPLAFVHGYSADIGGSIELARNIVLKGLPHAYAPSLANPDLGVYPPAYYYVLGLLGAVYQRFFSPSFDRTLTLDVMLKLVPILGDCLVALILYSLVRRLSSTRMARWVAAYNPRAEGRPVYMAGQVMQHLTRHGTPTRAEVCHVFDLFERGYAGFVLSDETAIGDDPVRAVRTLDALLKAFGG